jgi:hypothetical protein
VARVGGGQHVPRSRSPPPRPPPPPTTENYTAAGWRHGLVLVLSCAGVLAIAAFLAMSVPATIPLVVSFSLFALHVIHRKATA